MHYIAPPKESNISQNQIIFYLDLVQSHPKPHTPPPPTLMLTMFFTVPIMSYFMNGGKTLMVDLEKAKKRRGHWT